MDRTRAGPIAPPTNRDLTVGLIGAILSLALTMFHNMTDGIDEAALLQSVVPIQQLISRLIRRIQISSPRRLASKTLPVRQPLGRFTPSTPRRTTPSTQPRQILDTTRTRPDRTRGVNKTTNRTTSFEIPPGWREISNLDSYLNESSEVGLGMGSEAIFDQTSMMSGFEYSQDMDYYPTANRDVAELEDSDQFLPIHQSTRRDPNQTYSPAQPLPRRVDELRRPAPRKRTFHRADGTYAVRETINTTNPDGSFQRITKTVSGPDVSIIQDLSDNPAELPSPNRTRTEPSSAFGDAGPASNMTFGINPPS